MGRFKNNSNINNPVIDWLLDHDYKNFDGALGEKGFTRIYKVNDIYNVWVTINLDRKEIYVYKEYDCGGEIGRDVIKIEEEWTENLNIFIDKVDQELEFWIGEN